MKKIAFLYLILTCLRISASIEYIAGNIEYRHITGSCPSANYDITINIFTKQSSPMDSIFIYFGDGTHGYVQRINTINSYNQITHSIYNTNHIYGCGIFNVSYTDTISNFAIKNSGTNAISYYYLSSKIILNGFYPHNDSYSQFNLPALKISKNNLFNFNVISSTNSNLIYDSIIHSFVSNLNSFNLYLPVGVSINKYSGEIQWINPDTIGSYAFIVNTMMYKNGNNICTSIHYYNFEVINQMNSFTYDSINNVSVNINNFKEIVYTAGNTYSFSAVYNDLAADSIKLINFPIDFFTSSPIVNVIQNNSLKNTLFFSWSPQVLDERVYPYNFVLKSISYYPNDSISASYQTVSFVSDLYSSIDESNNFENHIPIYPNPTTSFLNIVDKDNQLQNATIQIKNYLGQVVLSSPFTSQINLSNLSLGMYFLTIQDKSNSKTVKIIKE